MYCVVEGYTPVHSIHGAENEFVITLVAADVCMHKQGFNQ